MYVHILYMRAGNAQGSMCICTDSPEPSMLGNSISTKISCAVSFMPLINEKRRGVSYNKRFARFSPD